MPEDLESEATGEPSKPGKKKFPLKMVLIAAIVLAVVGGAGVYLFRGKGGAAASGAVKKKKDTAIVLVPMEPFILNLADPGRFLKMTLQFEATDAAGGQLISLDKPELRDAIITLMGNETVDDIMTADGKMQLKDDIILRANQVLGKPVVKDVYFTEFVMQ